MTSTNIRDELSANRGHGHRNPRGLNSSGPWTITITGRIGGVRDILITLLSFVLDLPSLEFV